VAKSASVAIAKGDPRLVGDGARALVRMQDHPRPRELGERLGQEVAGHLFVDQQRLGGIAHAGPVRLGVDGDGERLVEVGGGIDIDVAVADAGLDDGHGGVEDDGVDQVRSAARDEQVDQAAGGHQGADGIVAAAIEQADRVGVDALCGKGFAHDGDQDAVGGGGRRATAQDDGVAGLQAESGGVDGDIGARLVDHPDDAHRHADLADLQAVGQGRAADDLAHRVGQSGDIAHGLGDRGDPRRGEARRS
jgi:hypothetical protein